jgi:UDP-GlcNAc:undecaprenyl-phosphate GlcNAc-1-phosphate transferase
LIAASFSGFVITAMAILALRPLALTLDLVDRPGGRKTHHGIVPLVGGLAMFLGISATLGLFPHEGVAVGPILGACALLTVIGLIDDRFALSHWMRLGVHLSVALVLVKGTGALVQEIGNPFGGHMIALGPHVSLVFTVLLITGAINAYNMLDGMDGLAGVSALMALGGLAVLARRDGAAAGELFLSVALGASVCGFLIFNLPVKVNRRFRCFMGDAGSTLLGIVVAWLCIRVSQLAPHTGVKPVTVLWMVAMPLYELFWTVIRRSIRGKSPLRADAEHSHHLLMKAGLTVRAAFVVMAVLEATFVGIGLLLNEWHVPDVASFAVLIMVGVLTIRSLYSAQWILNFVPIARRTYRRAESPAR